MESFLEKTANYISEKYSEHISELCIVLPNRRASLFLRKHLAKAVKKNIWSPGIFSIEDFIFNLSGLNIIDNTSLLFELYEIHKEIAKDKAQEFDEFCKWAQVLIQDYNELDQHLANIKSVFGYLSDLKELSKWNPEQVEPTEFQIQYISFFQSLFIYYDKLNHKLTETNSSYTGAAYRFVADNLSDLRKEINYHKIIFVGFNALSEAEEKIIFELEHEGVAEVLWDADQYFFENPQNGVYPEAGLFLRKFKKHYKKDNFNWVFDELRGEKNITIYGVPKMVGQAKLCGEILDQNPEILEANHNSAVVLADENLLFPILNSLPNIKQLNATMGIPLSSTPIFDLLSSILNLHYKSSIYQTLHKKTGVTFNVKDILKIVKHSSLIELYPFLSDLNNDALFDISTKLAESNKRFYKSDEIMDIIDPPKTNVFFRIVFKKWDEATDILQNIREILESLRDAFIEKHNQKNIDLKIEIEYIYVFSLLMGKIANYQQKYRAIKSLKSFISFFNQLCKAEKLSLYGEPLQGLQLMGMLETRTLDFENLILCSVNENTLPGSSKHNSFIPFDIRREFELPTYREKNAIFAYHFFRLIQRAKNIHLIYNTEADPVSGGDKSRFLYQLQEELVPNSKINISEKIIGSNVQISSNHSFEVEKTPEVIKALTNKAKKGFSPSVLNNFKRCQMQFYFSEVAQLGEKNEMEEVMDAATLGQIIHEVLQIVYEPFTNQVIQEDFIEEIIKNLDIILSQSFENLFKDGNIKTGKNLLITKVAKRFLQNFLKHEISNIKKGHKIQIQSLEEQFSTYLSTKSISIKSLEKIRFKGILDRIDKKDGTIRIIDYKTGAVNPYNLYIKEIDDIFTNHDQEKSFQLLFYHWLYKRNHKEASEIQSGIYSLKKLSNGFMPVKLNKSNIDNEIINKFEQGLLDLINNIFDPSLKFTQTDDLNICKYCNYKQVCNK